ncbi:uncharacterized protein LOC134240963 [Saccostrea cucullata]|uniref:uncharacterized protein LOC134240963 n=1 Tax=Saccostrea cuccullata TaxID=36930 RepID=UPI002ED2DDED
MVKEAEKEKTSSTPVLMPRTSKLPALPAGYAEKASDVNTYGIGSSVSSVLKETPRLNISSLQAMFNIQENNLWKLGANLEETFGIDITKCMDILQGAGLNSLGKKVGDEVLELISSALALLLIHKIIVPELFPLDFSNQLSLLTAFVKAVNKLQKMKIDGGFLEERLKVSMETYIAKRQKYDWVCDMLELGHTYEEVASKMLGYTSSLETKAPLYIEVKL